MDLHNSHVTHVGEVQEGINSETLEDLKNGSEWIGMLQLLQMKDYLPLLHGIDIFIDATNLLSNRRCLN